MKQGFWGAARGTATIALTALTLLLAGCGNFFIKESSGGGGGTNTTGDFLYIANSTAGDNFLAGYDLSAGTLAPMSTPTFNLGFVPSALTIAPGNGYMYVASQSGGLYLYSIAGDGSLTIQNNKGALVTGLTVAAMDVSGDGNYLYVVEVDITGTNLIQYTRDTSTGLFTAQNSIQLPVIAGSGCTIATPCGVKAAPSGFYVAVALGLSGDVIYPLSSGQLQTGIAIAAGNSSGDYAVTIDNNNFVYFANTNGVDVYSLSGNTATVVTGSPFSGGAGPRSIILSNDKKYVYNASYANGAIYDYLIGSTGALTPLTPSTVTAPSNVSALASDNSGKYVVALGYNSSGLSLYTIGSTGALVQTGTSIATNTSANGEPAVMAVTH